MEIVLSKRQIEIIEKTIAKGDRVEIIPVKDGVKVVRVKRETIQTDK